MPFSSFQDISRLVSNPSWDLIVILFFVAAVVFYGLVAGRRYLVSVLISTYISAFIFENFRFLDFLAKDRGIMEVFLIRSASFFVILILVTLALSRLVRRDLDAKIWWQIFLLSFLEVGLLMSLMFRFLPVRALFTFSPVVENLFAGEAAFFWWLIGPIVALWVILR